MLLHLPPIRELEVIEILKVIISVYMLHHTTLTDKDSGGISRD